MNLIFVRPGLVLRSFSLTDSQLLFNAVDENRDFLSPWINWVSQYNTIEDATAFIRYCSRAYQEGTGLSLGIWDNDVLVGEMSLTYIDNINDVAHIGYWLIEKAQGKGLMQDVAKKLIEYAFESLGMNRLEIRVGVDNIASIRVAERLGFEEEAVLKKAGKIRDEYFDVKVFSRLK